MGESMKAYLDNNIVSAIATESGALKCLLDAYDQGTIDLVTSELPGPSDAELWAAGRKVAKVVNRPRVSKQP
jgi:hypothetical protein